MPALLRPKVNKSSGATTINSPTHRPTIPVVHSFTHQPTSHALTHYSLIHLPTHSLTHPSKGDKDKCVTLTYEKLCKGDSKCAYLKKRARPPSTEVRAPLYMPCPPRSLTRIPSPSLSPCNLHHHLAHHLPSPPLTSLLATQLTDLACAWHEESREHASAGCGAKDPELQPDVHFIPTQFPLYRSGKVDALSLPPP